MPAPFRFDRSWRFDLSSDELWSVLAETSAYPRWWSWLRDYDAGPLERGAVARFRVRPPLPYALSFTVTIDDVVVGERVTTTVSGDAAGPAELVLTPTADGGSQARLVWSLQLRRPALARLERVARPAMVWGHDIVVSMGIRQFRRRALGA